MDHNQIADDYLFQEKYPFSTLEATLFRFLAKNYKKLFSLNELISGCVFHWQERNPLEFKKYWKDDTYKKIATLLDPFIVKHIPIPYYRYNLKEYFVRQILHSERHFDITFVSQIDVEEFYDMVKSQIGLNLQDIPRTKQSHIRAIIKRCKYLLVEELFDTAKKRSSDFFRILSDIKPKQIRFVARHLGIEILENEYNVSLLLKILYTRVEQFPKIFVFDSVVGEMNEHYEVKWKGISQTMWLSASDFVRSHSLDFSRYLLFKNMKGSFQGQPPKPWEIHNFTPHVHK